MSEETVSAFLWVKFIVGATFFAALLYVQFILKNDVSIFLYGLVGVLMGVDPVKLIGVKK